MASANVCSRGSPTAELSFLPNDTQRMRSQYRWVDSCVIHDTAAEWLSCTKVTPHYLRPGICFPSLPGPSRTVGISQSWNPSLLRAPGISQGRSPSSVCAGGRSRRAEGRSRRSPSCWLRHKSACPCRGILLWPLARNADTGPILARMPMDHSGRSFAAWGTAEPKGDPEDPPSVSMLLARPGLHWERASSTLSPAGRTANRT